MVNNERVFFELLAPCQGIVADGYEKRKEKDSRLR